MCLPLNYSTLLTKKMTEKGKQQPHCITGWGVMGRLDLNRV